MAILSQSFIFSFLLSLLLDHYFIHSFILHSSLLLIPLCIILLYFYNVACMLPFHNHIYLPYSCTLLSHMHSYVTHSYTDITLTYSFYTSFIICMYIYTYSHALHIGTYWFILVILLGPNTHAYIIYYRYLSDSLLIFLRTYTFACIYHVYICIP
jgi:hypothetical protein